MSDSLSIDQRNYRRVLSDYNHALYQHGRIKEQLDTLTAELDAVEQDIKNTRDWLNLHKRFKTPEPIYNIRTQRAPEHDPEERAWDKSDQQ